MKLAPYILSAAIGFALAFLFFKPKVVENIVIKTETITDTVYAKHVERIPFPDLTYLALEDSIEHYRSLYEEELGNIKIVKENDPFSAPLRGYSGTEATLYGNIGYNAVVAGKMLDMSITHDLRLPTITNTVTTEKIVTKTRDLRGLYAGASASLDLDYKIGASYVDRDWQFNYDYQPKVGAHWVGVKRRVF